jgi:hypothetical protein
LPDGPAIDRNVFDNILAALDLDMKRSYALSLSDGPRGLPLSISREHIITGSLRQF